MHFSISIGYVKERKQKTTIVLKIDENDQPAPELEQ
jgi:hypothetical protein